MQSSDEVRRFYAQASDATWAFEYRLERAVKSLDESTPDYIGLTNALIHLSIPSAITIMIRDRDKLLRIVGTSDFAGLSSLSFLQEFMNIVKMSGDTDLISRVTCSYARKIVNSLLIKPEGYSSAIGLLEARRDDFSVSRSVRAEAALTIAEIMFKCGDFAPAMKQVRKAMQLTQEPAMLAQCFHIAGDIGVARGTYRWACRRYERAMSFIGGIEKTMRAGTVLAQKWAIAEMKSGNTSEPIEETVELILSSQNVPKSKDVIVLFCLVLEMSKLQENQFFLGPALRLCNTLKRLSAKWRECCKLSLAIADYLIEHGQYNKSVEHLDYVIRLASQYHNPVDMVDALLLSAKACWCQGRFLETLKAIRTIRSILRKQRPTLKIGLTTLLRAKIAFYKNALRRTIRLSMRTKGLFAKETFCHESFESVRIVATASMWLGKPAVGTEVLGMCPKTQRKIHKEPDGIVASCFVLASTCYADNRQSDAERWLQMCRDLTYTGANSKTQVIKTLAESEACCQQHTYKEAKEAASLAIERAWKLNHKLLQAICHYQLIKALAMGGKNKMARKCLNDVSYNYPYCERMMWKHAAIAIKKDKPALSEFKPIGAFLF